MKSVKVENKMRTKDLLQQLRDYFLKYDDINFEDVKKYLQNENIIRLCKECVKVLKSPASEPCRWCSHWYTYILKFETTLKVLDIESDKYE